MKRSAKIVEVCDIFAFVLMAAIAAIMTYLIVTDTPSSKNTVWALTVSSGVLVAYLGFRFIFWPIFKNCKEDLAWRKADNAFHAFLVESQRRFEKFKSSLTFGHLVNIYGRTSVADVLSAPNIHEVYQVDGIRGYVVEGLSTDLYLLLCAPKLEKIEEFFFNEVEDHFERHMCEVKTEDWLASKSDLLHSKFYQMVVKERNTCHRPELVNPETFFVLLHLKEKKGAFYEDAPHHIGLIGACKGHLIED